MASSKISSFKVKLKSVSHKKRRKSDLVVMWHSIVDATVQIITTIHFLLSGVLESTRLLIWHDEVQEVRHFLKNYLPYVPDNFSYSWRDGKLLCILLNKLQPGCIPDATTLDHNYALRNMYHAFDVLERKFGISPSATVEQLVVCVEGSHLKLLDILTQLKKETENKQVPSINVEEVETESEKQDICSNLKNSVCKGTGLMVAFAGRPANFVVFSSAMTDISLVIEIKGPCNTVCRERITKRSPKKKISTTLLEQNKPSFFRSNSYSSERNNYLMKADKADDSEKNLIPLEYEISLDKICVTYIPLVEGQHVISILWYGQHASDSPYVVKVEPKIEVKGIYHANQLKPTLGFQDNSDDNANKERKNGTVTIQKPVHKIERIGKVIKRRVLRHIVKIKDKDIIVDSNDIDHLAAALLKMDYEIQTDPSKSRRNSWGFAGDAERKISAIRQFCIPLQELEAQNMKLQGRSRSLTINTNPRMPLRRSNSFEGEDCIRQTKLETVSEDSIHVYMHKLQENMDQDEEVFAYINEDFQTSEQGSGGNQTRMFDDNNEKVTISLDAINSNVQENMLQSLPTAEEKEDSRNDLNAISCLKLPQYNLTGSSKFSERSAVENEMQYNPDIYDDIENELKINAKPFSDIHNILTLNGAFNKPDNFQDQNKNETCSKTNTFDDKTEIVKIYNDLGEKNNCENHDTLVVPVEKFPNLEKCNVPFSELVLSEKNNSKETFPFLSSPLDKPNNWRLPLNKCSTNVHSVRMKNRNQNCFESRKYCKSCRRLETLNKKLTVRSKKTNKNNTYYSKTINSESFCSNFTVNGDTGISENKKIDLNPEVVNKNDPQDLQQNNQEFGNSKLKFFESPGKYSFYYYPHSFDHHTNLPESTQSSGNIETNIKRNLKGDTIPLSSKMATFTNFLENSYHNYLYNNSTLRLNYDSSNNLSLSAIEFDNPMIKFKEETNEYQIKEHNLVSLGQYNYNQFNPSTEKNKGSLIKNKIKKLERAMMRDSQKVNSKCSSQSSISSDTVNVKDKLTFWENLSRKDGKDRLEANIADDSNAEVNHFQDESVITNKIRSEIEDTALKVESAACEFFWPRDETLNDTKNNVAPNDEDISLHQDVKFPLEHKNSFKMKRSFSDPVLLDPILRDSLLFAQNPLSVLNKLNHVSSTDNMSSSGDYLESSIDDGLYSSDPFVSTEDEYIDDEIPGNPVLNHWGDLNIMKSLKTANISKHKEYCQFIDSEILKKQFQSVEICPSECKVFGIGTYYGYVAVKNRFQVLTKGAGNGNLSASVQGFGKHDVSFVSVKYKHKDIYEVTYQVLRPGLYLISLLWMEKPIVGSPFLCKVTF